MITFVGCNSLLMLKTMKRLLFAFLGLFILGSCVSESPYAQPSAWYDAPYDQTKTDVFFILPTVVHDWVDSLGQVQHWADVNNPENRAKMTAAFAQCAPIFSDSSNFVAPYYSQISLESWALGDSVVEARFARAMSDVRQAFDYYITHKNPDRPFVLAGYSQGGKAVVELLKTMSDQTFDRVVANYVIGYRITQADRQACSKLVPAADSLDTGVTICYNSVADVSGISPVLVGNTMCINPLNWRVDATPASVWDTVSVAADPIQSMLIVSGLDAERYYRPAMGDLFPLGCYHPLELVLYGPEIQRNVKKRIAAF